MKKVFALVAVISLFASCSKSKLEDGVKLYNFSKGSTLELNGLVGAEAGSAAGNIVYVDFSTETQTTLERAKWDLAFYCGAENRVRINNTTAAMAVVLDKIELDAVSGSDATGLTFEVDITSPSAETFAKIDAITGEIEKTVIPEIFPNPADNKIVIIGRGTGGATPRRDLIKAKFGINENGEYTIQWGKLDATTYQTATIAKDEVFNFKYLSFDDGLLASAEPQKKDWDIVWGTSIYETPNGNENTAYIFSDMVGVNYLSGVQSVQKTFNDVNATLEAFENYSLADAQTEEFSDYRWNIGAKWRTTAAPGVTNPGVKKDRFYVVKDTEGVYYKLIFMSFSGDDGGVRGRPKFSYKLLQ